MNISSDNEITVLVTGVGAIIGQGIIKSIRKSKQKVRIVGLDRSSNSPGPSLCDVFYKKPTCDESDEDYLEFWITILQQSSVNIVLPGLEVDTFFLMASNQYSYLKSSLVKQVAQMGNDGDLQDLVPPSVIERLKEKFGKSKK